MERSKSDGPSTWWDFVVGWIFGILSVFAILFARKAASKIEDIKDEIPKG